MSMRSGGAARWWRGVAAMMLVAGLGGCASQPETASVAIPKVPAGMARAWFYREDEPYNGMDRPYVRMNGAIVGISELGGAFYRDLPPGPYYVTVDSYRSFTNQFPHVYLTPGETAYFQVFERGSVSSGVGASRDFARPSFDVWVMPAAIATPQVGRSLFYPGGD